MGSLVWFRMTFRSFRLGEKGLQGREASSFASWDRGEQRRPSVHTFCPLVLQLGGGCQLRVANFLD